jgi:hypothetical protein
LVEQGQIKDAHPWPRIFPKHPLLFGSKETTDLD